MPRIPDVQSLGERPGYGGATPLADTSGVGAPVQSAAGSVQRQAIRDGGIVGEAAQALEGLTKVFQDARVKTQNRSDTIERIRAIQDFEATATGELVRMQAEEDFSRQDTSRAYLDGIRKKSEELIANHPGTEDSKFMLASDLEERLGGYTRRSAEAMIGAQRKIISDQTASDIGRYAREAYETPENLQRHLLNWGNQLERYRGALTADEEIAALKTGVEQIAVSGIQSFVDSGQYVEAAQALATLPDQVLSPQTALRLHRDITIGASSGRRETNAFDEKRSAVEGALGRPLSQDEILQMSGAAPPRDSLGDKEDDPPKRSERKDGDEIVTEEWDPNTRSWNEVSRAPRDLDPYSKMIEAITKGRLSPGDEGSPTTKKGSAGSKSKTSGTVELQLGSDGLPIIKSQEDYDKLGNGAYWYADPSGKMQKAFKGQK